MKNRLLGLLLAVFLVGCGGERTFDGAPVFTDKEVKSSVFVKDATDYFAHELKFSLDEFGTPENTPKTLLGEPQGGDFANASWAQTLMRYMVLSGKSKIGDHELLPWIHTFLLKEAEGNGPTFAQLFTVATLYLSCEKKGDLSTSKLWKTFTKEEQQLLINYVDAHLFWDEEGDNVGGRANNYFGVALHIDAYGQALGIAKSPESYKKLMAKNMAFIRQYKGFLDDSSQFSHAYDRYLHEYIRFIWESAELVGDKETMAELLPYIKETSQLWWDLYNPAVGHSSAWGRSRQNSWDDTFEQAAFYATHPEISPASPAEMAAVFVNAWNCYFTQEYNPERHLNRMLDEGRATYGYAGRARIWSYTIGTLSKAEISLVHLREAIKDNGLKTIATAPTMTDHSKIVYYKEPNFGVWTYRSGALNVALPFVGNGASTDYLPIPYGYPGIEAPVQRTMPTLVPYFRTADGSFTVCDGASTAQLAGNSGVKLTWKDLQTLKGADSGLGVAVSAEWTVAPKKLTLKMTFMPEKTVQFTGIDFWVPLNAAVASQVKVTASWDTATREITQLDKETYNGGAFHPIDRIVCFEGGTFRFEKGKRYELSMEVLQ